VTKEGASSEFAATVAIQAAVKASLVAALCNGIAYFAAVILSSG